MTASRDLNLSPYLQWVVDFTQGIENSSPGTCDLSKLTRVMQDSFPKKTLMAGIQDLAECDELIFVALRCIDKKRDDSDKKQIDEKTYKECAREFAPLLTHLISKEQAIYHEVMRMSVEKPDQYKKLFGYIKVGSGNSEIATPEEVAMHIVKGYGFGILQHFIAIYGNMVTESRGENNQFVVADALYFQLFRLNLSEIVRVESFLNVVKTNQKITVNGQLVDQLIDDSLRNTQMKNNVDRVLGEINKANIPFKSKKLSSKLAADEMKYRVKYAAYIARREEDALGYKSPIPLSPTPSARSSSMLAIALARTSSANALSSSSLASSPARVLTSTESPSPASSPRDKKGKPITSLINIFKKDNLASPRSLTSSPTPAVTSPREESVEVKAEVTTKTSKRAKSKKKFRTVGSAPPKPQSEESGDAPSFVSIFKEDKAAEEPSFTNVFKEEPAPQKPPTQVETIFKLASSRKSKLAGDSATSFTRSMPESDTTLPESPVRKASTPKLAKRGKLSTSTETMPHRRLDSSEKTTRTDVTEIPELSKNPKSK